ncbi:M15 family metallopeptidase [Actinotalea fermentans]|uniref:M15 family metallopeptidase n=1 Tax=Actinotalea fermentans TaxID=43671 RepID=UPI0011BD8D67|nr:M15 family metallopeptidase [Actinotalea fermentans]
MRLRLPLRRPLPWRARGLTAMAAAAAVALLAGMLTGLQIRAAQAQERRDEIAAEEAAEAARIADERAQTARSLARDRLETLERGERLAAWAVASGKAQAALTAAEGVLAGSEGAVPDDAVRSALAAALDALRALLDAAPDDPSAQDATALAEATTAVVDASAAVTAAQAAWQAEQDAAAAAAAAAAARARESRSGAGADCGGSGISEPSTGGAALHTSVPAEDGDGSNGRMPRSAMTALGWCTDSLGNQQWLRTDAAQAMVRLNDAFRAQFGENIAIDLSYRSYEDQVRARELYGGLAARPGTSNHGLGTAVDTWEWAAYDFGSERYAWLVANGPAYGWHNPAASEPGNPEYWHFEYRG